MAAKDVVQYRQNAIHAAQDLGYGDETIRKIRQADSESEITRIMRNARKEKFGD